MTALYIILGIVAFLAALIIFLIFPAARRHPDRKILSGLYIAHRGLHDLEGAAPENSLSAYRLAVEKGFAIEIDIHITADGEIVVFHDDTPKRVCGASGKIEDMTLSELKALRLAGTDEQIPTLRECLDTVDGRVPLLIEFKCLKNPAPLCEAANEILKDYKGKYFIQSFYPPVLAWYRKNRPDICRGQLSTVFGKDDPGFYVFLTWLFTNVIARPDFVSYDFLHKKQFFRRLCTLLGAFPVGWTFTGKEQVESAKDSFDTYIFENFLPDRGNTDAKK
ncbi:MAG: glycerophosphodiester phosphodiesterase [Ruminococcaceae bacterium]|nr:glycerophosphodiester phosphodiesterase [Oscillospiraceae bacterium]